MTKRADAERRLAELAEEIGPLPCSMLAIGTEPPRSRWLLARDLLLAVLAGSAAGWVLANLSLALWSM